MSLSDLRKELKDMRKSAMPVPVSRMKKTDVARELERLRGLHHTEVKKVEAVMKEESIPKKVVKKVEAVQKMEHKKQEEVVKTVKSKPSASEPKPKKVEKGSQEAKDRMAALRAMRTAKKKDE